MAAHHLPDALAMRHFRTGAAPEAERERVAEDLRAAGRGTQALLLYEGRAGHPSLERERERAVGDGQTFRLLTLKRLGAPVADADLRAAAEVAAKAGRAMEARLGYMALGELDSVRALASQLPPGLVPPPPPEPPAATDTR